MMESNNKSILTESSPKQREGQDDGLMKSKLGEEEEQQDAQQSHLVSVVAPTIRQQNDKDNELFQDEPPHQQEEEEGGGGGQRHNYRSFSKYNYIRSWWPSSSSSYSFVPSSSSQQHQINNNDDEQHWISILLFCSCIVLLFADQNLMAPNLTEISKEFDFSEIERDKKLGGDIALAFYLIGAPVAILIGCLTDSIHINRIRLLSITICMGETSCILTYFISTYPQLFICRSLTGISIAGSFPILYSLVGDMFRSKNRSTICAIMYVGTGLGVSFGQGIAGYIGSNYGWRIPFLIIGIPSLVNAILIYFVVNDPKRGCKEEATIQYNKNTQYAQQPQEASSTIVTNKNVHNKKDNLSRMENATKTKPIAPPETTNEREYCGIDNISSDHVLNGEKMQTNHNHGQEESSMMMNDYDKNDMSSNPWTKISSYSTNSLQSTFHLLSIKSILLGMIQGLPGCIPWGIYGFYLNDFLSENRNYTIEAATTVMLCFNFGHIPGLIIGAKIGEYLYSIEKRYAQLFSGFMVMLGCIPFWILLNYVDANETPYWYVCSVAAVGGVITGPTGPIVKSTMVNVTVPTYRGQGLALCILFDDLGKGFGPYFISLLIIHFNGNRLPAFNIGVCGWIICGILNALLYFTVEKDEYNVQQYQYCQFHANHEKEKKHKQHYRDEEVGDLSFTKSNFTISDDDDEEILGVDNGRYNSNDNSNNVISHIIRRHHHNGSYASDGHVPAPRNGINDDSILEMTDTNNIRHTDNPTNKKALIKRSIS